MLGAGRAPATAHQTHRTVRTAQRSRPPRSPPSEPRRPGEATPSSRVGSRAPDARRGPPRPRHRPPSPEPRPLGRRARARPAPRGSARAPVVGCRPGRAAPRRPALDAAAELGTRLRRHVRPETRGLLPPATQPPRHDGGDQVAARANASSASPHPSSSCCARTTPSRTANAPRPGNSGTKAAGC